MNPMVGLTWGRLKRGFSILLYYISVEMNNELIKQKSCWKRNWKWIVPAVGVILISMGIFFSFGMDGLTTDLVQAYANQELYEHAIVKANSDERVIEVLGKIKPIDKLAILEGEVHYSNKNKTINTSIRIIGKKGKARLDIVANRVSSQWKYTKINVRIKNPPEKRQIFMIAITD